MSAGRIKTDANSSYNSLQLGLTQRYSSGLQFQVAYTWSRLINDAEGRWDIFGTQGLGNAQDPFDRGAERGLGAPDIRHNIVTNFSYDLPFGNAMSGFGGKVIQGWRLNGILTTRTGNPVTLGVIGTRSGASPFSRSERPNLVPGRSTSPVLGGPDQYYDPTAFELQPAGFYGNVGRNTLIGPGFASFDFGLAKDTALSERRTLQFRFEAFNLFNRPNFGTPNRNVFRGSSPAGNAGRVVRTVGTSRQIQFLGPPERRNEVDILGSARSGKVQEDSAVAVIPAAAESLKNSSRGIRSLRAIAVRTAGNSAAITGVGGLQTLTRGDISWRGGPKGEIVNPAATRPTDKHTLLLPRVSLCEREQANFHLPGRTHRPFICCTG